VPLTSTCRGVQSRRKDVPPRRAALDSALDEPGRAGRQHAPPRVDQAAFRTLRCAPAPSSMQSRRPVDCLSWFHCSPSNSGKPLAVG
jgi:hypothetical protein